MLLYAQVAAVEGLLQQAQAELSRWQAELGFAEMPELTAAMFGADMATTCKACSSAVQEARNAGAALIDKFWSPLWIQACL